MNGTNLGIRAVEGAPLQPRDDCGNDWHWRQEHRSWASENQRLRMSANAIGVQMLTTSTETTHTEERPIGRVRAPKTASHLGLQYEPASAEQRIAEHQSRRRPRGWNGVKQSRYPGERLPIGPEPLDEGAEHDPCEKVANTDP